MEVKRKENTVLIFQLNNHRKTIMSTIRKKIKTSTLQFPFRMWWNTVSIVLSVLLQYVLLIPKLSSVPEITMDDHKITFKVTVP
jgi:hypothetical protein